MAIFDLLNYYQDLSPEAKTVARERVLAFEEEQYKSAVTRLKRIAVSNIHILINNPYHIRSITNHLQTIRKYQQAPLYQVERWLIENLCMFDAAGRYYLFSQQSFY
ncbi:hypothetical protein [Xenorhabdus sp. KJ12.1]|uniref:hypothetical protein n=1 Tax=Xenorhabdus sp. KJ12.1 TaxID=1851571 RepID=UPI000C051EB2|nr:hypothetical protein [Xenorhabdus sp. KJ12.1]PHM72277.1 hypothetical protein Xekj_00555 [Xenorhabdus sp. KJ12.1]